ncbi:SAM-dependent chlorinase/fluorinase [Weissella viridescens]|uniref:SAM hydrolase/SAM-dependent halogenase family protein n=1 Tax=Weissella viridescens TaxID=1629 RepID=UPI0017473B7C|nr:SAM-dependent chlorinase/fluorinase [Weissella viridescens]QOD85515.1 SAM-dependent chlorinase/fluorinase [Weissella viridescens]
MRDLVIQTDFGLKDGAVSTMYGVAYGVSDKIRISELTQGITPFNIFEASFRLFQTVKYWKPGTVFVSVVDPGVGSNRKSIVAKLKTGQYVVTPDNGTLTHVAEAFGVEAVRVLDETIQRLPGSENSATFLGRDIYAYNGAKLASEIVTFDEIGKPLAPTEVVTIPLEEAQLVDNVIEGTVEITDVNFGSLWTNISESLWQDAFQAKLGANYLVRIFDHGSIKFEREIPFVKTFADVHPGDDLIYINSVGSVGVAIRMGNFEKVNQVSAGPEWTIEIKKSEG